MEYILEATNKISISLSEKIDLNKLLFHFEKKESLQLNPLLCLKLELRVQKKFLTSDLRTYFMANGCFDS
jgi:hypothetical protein